MRNLRYNQIGTVDADIDHAVEGEIPTTLDGSELAKALNGDYGAITDYVKPLEQLRGEQIESIKTEGLRRIGNLVDALSDFNLTMLVYKHMWPVSNPSAQLTQGKAVYDHAASRINAVSIADRALLETYDAATDAGWP